MHWLVKRISLAGVVTAVGSIGCGSTSIPPDGSGGEGVLARDEQGITSLAIDGFSVFWTKDDGSVKKVPIDGGPVTTLSPAPDPKQSTTAAGHVAVNDRHVFWTSGDGKNSTIEMMPKTGGQAVSIVNKDKEILGLAADKENVCWVFQDAASAVVECQAIEESQKSPQELPPGISSAAGPIVIFDGFVYFTDGVTMTNRPVKGGMPTLGITGKNIHSIAVSSTNLFWTDPGSASKTVNAANLGGDGAHVVASGADLGDVAGNSTDVFWARSDGSMNQAPIDKGAPLEVVKGPQGKVSFAIDTSSLYFANGADKVVIKRPITSLASPSGG